MATGNRMNREQFFAAIAGLGEDQLRKVLWTVYWRGTAAVRERVETEIAPPERRPAPAVREEVDPVAVLATVREFVALARSGAYLARSRAVSPKERSGWRFTYRRLFADARAALAVDDIGPGSAAMAELIDLACRMRDYDYFRSDDPGEAAGVVVSDEVGVLWGRTLEHSGFPGFAQTAAAQFLRWESEHGWTRRGFGKVPEKERPLREVLASLFTVSDHWVTFTEHYLAELDARSETRAARSRGRGSGGTSRDFEREQRTGVFTDWHLTLIEQFAGSDVEYLLDRVVSHPEFCGPDLLYVRSRLAHRRGDLDGARTLVHDALETLPGHHEFLAFARQIGAELPANARRVAEQRGWTGD